MAKLTLYLTNIKSSVSSPITATAGSTVTFKLTAKFGYSLPTDIVFSSDITTKSYNSVTGEVTLTMPNSDDCSIRAVAVSFNYENWLRSRLNEICIDLSLDDYKVEVYNEQDFTKPNMAYGLISVVVKHLTASKMFSTTVEPLQIMVMSEENGLDAAQIIFTKLFQTYNWYSMKEGTTSYKFQFTSPVVLNNFNIVGAGLRAVLYISATNYVMTNIADLEEFTENSTKGKLFIKTGTDNYEKIDVISFQMAYAMSGDAKIFNGDKFAKTVRSLQTLSIAIITPCVSSTFFNKINDICSATISGDTEFNLKFQISTKSYELTMRIATLQFGTAPNEAPGIQIGFTL